MERCSLQPVPWAVAAERLCQGADRAGQDRQALVFVFQPIFTMSAQQSQLKVMDQMTFNKFMRAFSRDTVSNRA